jgi:hypothetical protein
MDLRRVRAWDLLTGLAGAALLVSLFLPWYGGGATSASGWEAFTVIDIVLALAALSAMALPVVAAFQRTAAVPQSLTALIMLVAVPAALLAVIRLINLPGADLSREAGAWIGAAAALALLAFNYRSMGDKAFPSAMRPRLDVEVVPAPAPDGTRRDVQQ